MTILAVAVTALLAVLVSGAVSVQRASQRGTALTLAEKQLEIYRTLGFANIQLDAGCVNSLWAYNGAAVASCGYAASDPKLTSPGSTDPYFTGASTATSGALSPALAHSGQVTGACASPATHPECLPTQVISTGSSPDHRAYRVDTYISSSSSSGRLTKQIYVVVRDPTKSGKPILATDSSSFDQSGAATG